MRDLWQVFLDTGIALPLAASLVTGILIGIERELRSKPAGLRTHALVCFASTLLMLAAVRQGEWTVDFIDDARVVTDPTRMAHGVLTGIGFLGAGVIFREGPSVHGLTTAASLWVTAAIGLLYGVEMYWLAITGAASTLVVLIVLRVLYVLLPRRINLSLTVTVDPRSGFSAADLRSILTAQGLRAAAVGQHLDRAAGQLELSTKARSHGEDQGDRLAHALSETPEIARFVIETIDDDHDDLWGGR